MGEEFFLRFSLEDLADIESEFGEEFFTDIEKGCAEFLPKTINSCLAIGVKRRTDAGYDQRVWKDLDKVELQDTGFIYSDTAEPILEALSQAWLGKSYEELVQEAIKARDEQRKAQEEAQQAELKKAVETAAEVAKEAGLPFDGKASLQAISELLTNQASTPEQSGS
jgi:hypothetical protein